MGPTSKQQSGEPCAQHFLNFITHHTVVRDIGYITLPLLYSYDIKEIKETVNLKKNCLSWDLGSAQTDLW